MSVIVRLQNLPWAANAVDIRQYFHGLSIPEGGVHIVGGELGDAFIAFSTDEDARQAMLRDGGKVKEIKIRLFLSSRTEMQKIIDQARQQSLGMQQFMAMPTMPQMQVPVTSMPNMAVTSMPVPNVTMPTVQNVPGMQVPLQNVPNVTTMVSHMVTKPEDNTVVTPPAAVPPAIGVLPVQPESTPAAPPSTASSISVKGDSEKEKKDKRRRRTRSHSRDRSDSRSKSRSTSRSRSRSKDRKGRDRDRYYDRRRRRSRSRDRRRRRDRSRSRDRSFRDFRDKRRDFRHGSKEEPDENSQQSGSNSRWGQRNQQSKSRPEFFNRQQQNRNGSFGPRGPHNMNNFRPPFPSTNNDNINQNKNSTPPPSVNNARPPAPPVKDMDNAKQSATLNIDSVPIPPTPVSDSNPPLSNKSINTMSQSQNFFGGYPQNPPAFNPQEMVSYPTFNPSAAGSFNTGFNMPSSQQKGSNINRVSIEKPEISDKRKNISDIKDDKRNSSQPFKHQTNSYPTQYNKHESHSQSIIPGNPSETATDDIPLPGSMQKNNPGFGWGYGSGNYGFGNMNAYDDFGKDEDNSISNYQDSFQQPDWENPRESSRNSSNTKIQNTCVQIKSIPPRTTAEDIRAFFANSNIPTGWLKILGGDDNNNGVAYVRFTSIHDKKQAILRSGCLLNNAIVTVLHVDDSIYDNAVDSKSDYVAPSGFWNLNSREQAMENKQLQQQKLELQKQFQPPPVVNNQQQVPPLPPNQIIQHFHLEKKKLIEQSNKEVPNKKCIKIEGSVIFHPFFTNNHKLYPHIRSVCDKFKLVDVCVTNVGDDKLNGYMKFDNSVNIDNVLLSLSNAKIRGRPVIITGCTEEEFNAGKENCMPLDVQKFIETVRSHPKKSNFDSKSDKPMSKGGSDFPVHRNKHASQSPIERDYDNDDNDDDMEIDDELPPEELPRNKVLLPTPSVIMQPPMDENNRLATTNCIMLNNLPFQANDHDILDFFSDIGVIPTQIHIMLNANGKPSGDAFCEFERHEEAVKAATKNKCPMGYNTVFVALVPREVMENALGGSFQAQGPPQGPCFNDPVGPPMFGNARNNQPGPDWGPSFPPSGPPQQFEESYDYDDSYDMPQVGRGGRGGRSRSRGRGGRGISRGFERGGRGEERGRGSSRGFSSSYRGGGNPDIRGRPSSIRGSSSMRGSDRGRGSRGRGGREMREVRDGSRPVPLMSLSAGPVMGSDAPVNLQEESVRDFGRPGCVVSVENVPFRATIDDILKFFRGFNLAPDCVIRRYDDVGKITGDARIAFESPSEARRAVKFLNYKTLGTRKISLSLFK